MEQPVLIRYIVKTFLNLVAKEVEIIGLVVELEQYQVSHLEEEQEVRVQFLTAALDLQVEKLLLEVLELELV
jgi:hypothetical protein